MKTDIEIAQAARMLPIGEVAAQLGLRAQLVGLPLRVEGVVKAAHAADDDALQPIASYSNMTCVSTMSTPSMYSRTVCSPCSTLESSME